MRRYLYAAMLALLFTGPALACSPSMDYINQPYATKITRPLFIGEVTAVDDKHVTFRVLSSGRGWHIPKNKMMPSGDPARDTLSPNAGDTFKAERHDYGTCGNKEFKTGETWIYSGGDGPFGATTLLTFADLGFDHGADIGAVIERVAVRLGSPPLEPAPTTAAKDLPFKPGHFAWHSANAADHYDLTVTPLDTETNTHDITIDIAHGASQCHAEGTSAPHGYGEIVWMPDQNPDGSGSPSCRLVLAQDGGKVTVRQGDTGFACEDLFKCDKDVYLNSPTALTPLP